MIDSLLNIIIDMLQWIIERFTYSTGYSEMFHNAFNTMGGYLNTIKPMLPMDVLPTLIALVFWVELAIFGFKIFNYFKNHLPIIGGK